MRLLAKLASLPKGERAAWLVALRAPVPPGLRMVHASWLAHLTQREREAIDAPPTPANVWLVRSALAHIPPMLPRAVSLDLIAIGRAQLAFALGQGPGEGSRREAIKRAAGITMTDEGFARLGARTVAPQIARDRLAQLQLSRSYPREWNIEAELLAFALATAF
jgi:hypothetical protein